MHTYLGDTRGDVHRNPCTHTHTLVIKSIPTQDQTSTDGHIPSCSGTAMGGRLLMQAHTFGVHQYTHSPDVLSISHTGCDQQPYSSYQGAALGSLMTVLSVGSLENTHSSHPSAWRLTPTGSSVCTGLLQESAPHSWSDFRSWYLAHSHWFPQ